MSAGRILLAADIGGTNTRLVLSPGEPGAHWQQEHRYPSAEYEDFGTLLADYLERAGLHPQSACLAVAGPIQPTASGQRVQVTNLPWVLDTDTLEARFGVRFTLVNDFAAVGYALDHLAADEYVCLQAGEPRTGADRAVIGAGTGLGQAQVVQCSDGIRVLPTEGGHVDFAPRSEEQWHLMRGLLRTQGYVCYENLLSGRGLTHIYRFFQERRGTPVPEELAEALASGDAGAIIGELALGARDPVAVRALEEFVSLYGAQAGNWALNTLAFGGLYIAGGIAPAILPALQDGRFLDAFHHKGKMRDLMHRIPVHVITHRQPGLLGALALAAQRA